MLGSQIDIKSAYHNSIFIITSQTPISLWALNILEGKATKITPPETVQKKVEQQQQPKTTKIPRI